MVADGQGAPAWSLNNAIRAIAALPAVLHP